MYFEFLFKKGVLEKFWDLNLYEYNLLGKRKPLKSVALFIKNDRYSVT